MNETTRGKTYREHILTRTFVIIMLMLLVKVGTAGAAPFAYVMSGGDYINTGNISVIDTVSNTVTDTTNIGGYPGEVAATPDGTKIYVTDSGIASNMFSVITRNKLR